MSSSSSFSLDETAPFLRLLLYGTAMSGVGIYGLIIAVIISTGINPKAKSYYLFDVYAHLSSGSRLRTCRAFSGYGDWDCRGCRREVYDLSFSPVDLIWIVV
ncbi:hypothetical protein MLD38_022223 [Melastoma candidum]|uniref:Uncharacterized protein n=1 Tax=Melastoma candidum TaxID=119954 RepID=A0ACB9QJ35_9MYRT|nr:hypothetical protein MLD38_022223 [Melastoma candidum]